MADQLVSRFVPDDLWAEVSDLLDPAACSRTRARKDERTVLAAVAFVLCTGCTWREVPGCFGVAAPTAHRRFTEWTRRGLWPVLAECGSDPATASWARYLAIAAEARASAPTASCGTTRRRPATTDAGRAADQDRIRRPSATGAVLRGERELSLSTSQGGRR